MKRLIIIGFVLAALAAACGQPPVPEPEKATRQRVSPPATPTTAGSRCPTASVRWSWPTASAPRGI